MKDKYKAAIIGCGRIGCGFDEDPKRKYVSTHAKAYTLNPKIELIALVDINEEFLKKYSLKYNVPKTYTNYKEMLKTEQPDFISICTWNDTHHEIVEEATKYGVKGIFCEKPISNTIENANRIITECQKNNIILQIDHPRRFDPEHQKVKKYIEEGKLGKIQQANFHYTAGIANTGSHMFDLIRFYLGEVDWIQAINSINPSPNQIDQNYDGIIKIKNGPICTIQSLDVKEYLIFDFTIFGTKGMIKLTNATFTIEYYTPKDSQLFTGYNELALTKKPFPENKKEFMLDAIEHLINCVEKNKQSICSGEDGLAALELICAFHESANQDGKRIYLPLKESNTIINSR